MTHQHPPRRRIASSEPSEPEAISHRVRTVESQLQEARRAKGGAPVTLPSTAPGDIKLAPRGAAALAERSYPDPRQPTGCPAMSIHTRPTSDASNIDQYRLESVHPSLSATTAAPLSEVANE